MNIQAIKHIPKSNYCYAYDDSHLHIYLQTAKDDFESVRIILGDPHDYEKIGDKYYWSIENKPNVEMSKAYSNQYFDYWFIESLLPYKRCKYIFILKTKDKEYVYSTRRIKEIHLPEDNNLIYDNYEYFNYPYINEEDLIDSPNWSKDVIWYQIFPDRFNHSNREQDKNHYLPWGSITDKINNHMFFGGNIKGIIEKIPYLQELGITGIYFTPMFEAASAHKYDTTDYFKIDPSFGTNEDFKNLVTKCHEANIKVMLDGVFNHCGWHHPFFQDVVKNKKNSKYYDCFYIEDENFINFELNSKGEPKTEANLRPNYRTFAFTPFMPKLKTSNPIMEKYLLDVGKYWVKEYDIDGWRLDVSNEVSHSFWRKFRKEIKSIKNDVYILGENWDDSTAWLRGEQLDATMNYEISYPIWSFFGKRSLIPMTSEEFVYAINDLIIKYPKNISNHMFNLIDSHDTMRILNRCNMNIDLMKLSYLFLFSFTGAPSIYYGDEIGLSGENDPHNRYCMIWDEEKQNKDLFVFFQKLIKLRKTYIGFKNVDIKWHKIDNNILIYQKQNIIFIINNNDSNQLVSLNDTLKNQEYLDLFNNKEIKLKDNISLNQYDFYILKKDEQN